LDYKQKQVPAFVENGKVIMESDAIMKYIDDNYGDKGILYPNDP
jgi:glutathione S-transferase